MLRAVIKNIYYPVIDYLKRENMLQCYRTLEKSQYFPLEKLEAMQFENLKKIVTFASVNIPYYRRKFNLLKIKPTDFRTLSDLALLPPILKTDIRDNLSDFLDDQYQGKIYSGRTSGSTGIPLQLYHTPQYSSWDWASRWRARHWFDVNIGDREVALWGRPVDSSLERYWGPIKAFLRNGLLLSGFNLGSDDLARYWRIIKRFRPDFLYGYASSLSQFGRFVEAHVPSSQYLVLKGIFSAGETLHLPDKQVLSFVFHCPVSNEYGCSEVGAFAYECPCGNWHISVENTVVEFIDENGNPADEGEICVTALNNFYMPLIRYRIGDYGKRIAENCPCGRTLPLMKLTAARIVDVVKTRSGKVLSSNLFDYINDALIDKGVRGIKQFRVIQNDFENFNIQIVTDISIKNDALTFFETKMREYLGADISINFEFVSCIPQDKTGKIRSFISKIE